MSSTAIELTQKEISWLEAHPDITLGYTDSLEPSVIAGPNGQHTGMLVDALEQLNQRLGTRIKLRLDDIPTALENAQTKKVDGIVTLHPEYAENLGLLSTEVFWPDYPAVFARRGTSFKGPEDFSDQRVALIDKVYITQKMIDEHGKRTTVVKVKTALDGLRAVANGEADLFLGSSYNSYYLTKYQLLELVTAHVFLDTPTWQCVGVRSDWPELVSILNKGLSGFSESDAHNIIRTWSYLPADKKRLELTDEEQAWLAQEYTVRVHVANNPPFMITGNGEPSGIAIDYLRAASENIGINYEWVYEPASVGLAHNMVEEGNGPDLLPATMADDRWESSVSFTTPYMVSPVVIFTREDSGVILGMDSLAHQRVSVGRKTPLSLHIIENYPDIQLVQFDTAEKAMLALASAEVTAFVGNIAVGTHIIQERQLSNVKVAAPGPLSDRELAFAVRKDWPELLGILQKALDHLTVEEHADIHGKYLAVRYEHGMSPGEASRRVITVVSVAFLIILLFVMWNKQLRRQVIARTAEILEKESRFRRLVEQTPMAIEIHDLEGKIVQANPAFASMHNLEGEALNQILEHYNVRKDEQAEELGLQPYIERVYAGEDVIFPPYKYSTDEATKSVGHETAPHELWTQVRGFPLKNSNGQVINAVFFAEDITEQREAQLALKQEREYTDHLIQSANVMIVSMDTKGLITNMNPAAETVTGYQADELIGQNWMEMLIPPEHFPETHAALQEALSGTVPEHYENVILTQSGEERIISWSNSEIRRHDTVIGITSIGVDVTEQKQAQAFLVESEDRLRLATAAARVAIWDFDPRSNAVFLSPEWKQQLGYEDDEFESRIEEWESRLHPDEREEAFDMVEDYLAGRIPEYAKEFRLRHKDGSYRWIYTRGEKQLDDAGNPVRILGCHVDITERKLAQARLEESESRFRATFEQAAVGIAHVSPDGHFLRINQKFCDIVGYSRDEMRALTFQDITHPDDLDADVAEVQRLLDGEGDTYSKDKRYIHKNGSIVWITLIVSLIRDDDAQPKWFAAVVKDITEQKLAEMALQESEEKFRSFIEQSPTTFELYDTDGVLVQVNRAFENLWNLQADDVVNKFNVLESSQVEEVGLLPYIKRAFAGEEIGAIPDVDFNASREDVDNKEKSRERWLSNIVYPVRDLQGNVTHVVMMHEDITEQKQAERKVRDSESEFRSLIEQSPISIQILNPDGKITKVNQAFQKLWGISDEDLEEVMDTYNTFEDAQVEKLGLLPGIRRAFAGEDVILPVVEYDAPETMENLDLAHVMSNKRWIQARLYPVKNTEGELLNVVYMEEDMTEPRLADIRLQEYQKRLRALASELTLTEEQERRRIATELHDGAAQSLALARVKLVSVNKAVEDPKTTNKLDDLSRLLKESLQQIRGVLLDLSSPALNEIGLAAALSEWLEEQAGRREGLHTSFSNDCEDIQLSEDMLAMLFRNARELLMNTIKHADASRIAVKLHCVDQVLHIEVQDDGKGFNPDKRQKQPGSEGGFGLFSVYERMADMGGMLEIESAPGQGCKATLKMPMPHCCQGEK
ncbi:PAS domain S-box protein [Pontiella sulfatireligans]|uniref:histidine kinase n=1 Tax=Pontiella sulfatireligans TaxID=2750658 RepID=A0A6C2UVN5_9BACT|nr:PAS domain S-box protein [Pontiella sulfatireligans]VGO23461.1 putative diguanylate cyclase YegE [Pontiella sulfatireligans]